MGDTMKAHGEKLGYEVLITSGDMDPAKQKDQVNDFLVRKATAIILTPCDSRSVGTAIAQANQAGVPIFTADIASIADGAKVISHTATDNLEGGRVAGRAMVELLKGKGKVAILDHPEVESVLMRTKGFSEEVAKAPGIQIVAKLPGGGARDRSYAAAQDLLQSPPISTPSSPSTTPRPWALSPPSNALANKPASKSSASTANPKPNKPSKMASSTLRSSNTPPKSPPPLSTPSTNISAASRFPRSTSSRLRFTARQMHRRIQPLNDRRNDATAAVSRAVDLRAYFPRRRAVGGWHAHRHLLCRADDV
jgi:hypothetical protein